MKNTRKSRPTHNVYVVEGENDSAFWTKIGAAWKNADNEGLNVSLVAIPLTGRLIIRTVKPKDAEAGQ